MKLNAVTLDAAWNKMVVQANIAARTRGDERAASRLAARQAYLEFEKMRDVADVAYLARMSRCICD